MGPSLPVWPGCTGKEEHMGALFELGEVFGTPAALDLLEEAGIDPASLLGRHQSGDHGDVPEVVARNEFPVQEGYRIMSAYSVGDEHVWIITEGDRSTTTILLPEEY